MPFFNHPLVMGGVPTGVTFIGTNDASSPGTTWDAGNFTIPYNGLMVLVALGRASSANINSATIGGSAATLITRSVTNNAGQGALFSLVVNAGSPDVQIVWSSAPTITSCAVWLITGYTSSTAVDSFCSGGNTSHSSGTGGNINTNANGFACMAALHNNTNAMTISGGTAIVLDRDSTFSTARIVAGHEYPTASAAPNNYSIDSTVDTAFGSGFGSWS